MNYSQSIRSAITAFSVCAVFVFFQSTALALGKLSLTVRSIPIQQKKDTEKDKKDEVKVDVEQRKLEASLKNTSNASMTGVEVFYYFIGKSVGSSEMKILTKDTKKQNLAPGALLVAESKLATATFTGAHLSKPKKDSKEKPERVKAVGDKFGGWAVQVFLGEEMIAESYSSPALKTLMPAAVTSAVAAPTP